MLTTIRRLAFGLFIVLAGASGSLAATVSIVSMQYSKADPVPHLHYEGETVQGDVELLKSMFESFAHCNIECATEEGRPNAILTMNGPGGDYAVGLALADFLRANNIATVVEKGAYCYSACAFAFLGGTGYSTNDRIGSYVERMVEPGSIVGFHAPYFNEDALRAALEERSPTEIMGESRNSLSLMVKELVKWNVDPEIIFYMVDMGPDQTYDLVNADDLYLVRTALPPVASGSWMKSIPDAIRNACIRLLAAYERTDPLLLKDRITAPYEENIANGQFGPLSGYRLGDGLLDLGHCSATNESIEAGTNLEISLYMNPGIEGYSTPILSFFNRDDFFSTSGIGGDPLKRTFQRGGMAHWFLPVGVDIDSLDMSGELLILDNKFFTIGNPSLPKPLPALTVDSTVGSSRVSHNGNVWVFEQVGSTDLYDTVVANSARGVTLTNESVGDSGFIREGTYADGTAFSVFGFAADNGTSMVVRTLTIGAPATDEETALIHELQCSTSFGGVQLGC